ncbi:uncharacterized protein LOC122267760 [Penaeus japonicus]|uniref:uncharacterized protein LOC122267760 n=1 Tax=Penaeus japonicus TaxID=27405 RepID=UPI001C70F8AF|nr:uncharacterized protein LOC122267760 [Penaeus japonicus]
MTAPGGFPRRRETGAGMIGMVKRNCSPANCAHDSKKGSVARDPRDFSTKDSTLTLDNGSAYYAVHASVEKPSGSLRVVSDAPQKDESEFFTWFRAAVPDCQMSARIARNPCAMGSPLDYSSTPFSLEIAPVTSVQDEGSSQMGDQILRSWHYPRPYYPSVAQTEALTQNAQSSTLAPHNGLQVLSKVPDTLFLAPPPQGPSPTRSPSDLAPVGRPGPRSLGKSMTRTTDLRPYNSRRSPNELYIDAATCSAFLARSPPPSLQEADLALGPFGLTYSRSRVVDFSSPILIDYYRILTKRPRSEPDPKGFLAPFRWHVWVGLVLSVGVIGAVLFGVRKGAHALFGGEQMNLSKNASLAQHLWAVYGALISQQYTWMSSSWSGRAVVGTWWLVALIVARSYSSALTSMLAVRTVPVKYNYLRQVIGDPDIHLIFEKATALVEHMSTVQEGVYKELADTIQEDRAHFLASSKLYDAAYTDVRNKQYALLVEDTTCRKVFSDDFTKHGRCDFYIGKERYWPLIFCLIGRKGTPIMQAINSKIERLVSHDLYFKWLKDELPNATACLKASTKITVNEAYDLTGLWGVFVLFLGGMVAASLVLMVETSVGLVAERM